MIAFCCFPLKRRPTGARMSRGEPTLDELVASAGCGVPQPGFVVGSTPVAPRKRARCDSDAVALWDGAADEVCVILRKVGGPPVLADLEGLECGEHRVPAARRIVCPAGMTIDEAAAAAYGDELPARKFRAFTRRWAAHVDGLPDSPVPYVVAPSAQHTVGWVAQRQGRASGGRHKQLAVLLAPVRWHEPPRRLWWPPAQLTNSSFESQLLGGAGGAGVALINFCSLDAGRVALLRRRCPQLWKLTVRSVADAGQLGTLRELRDLEILHRVDGEDGVFSIAQACGGLRRLSLPCAGVTPLAVLAIASGCPALEELRVCHRRSHAAACTPAMLAALGVLVRLPRLARLAFAFPVGDADLRRLRDANPRCSVRHA
jgi:hypothetical protein